LSIILPIRLSKLNKMRYLIIRAVFLLLGINAVALAQNVGIGTANPDAKLMVVDNSKPLVFTAANAATLALNTKAGLAIKTGNYYTGGIFTTGTASAFARVGIYTYASTNYDGLRERLVVTDSGYVGINDTVPQVLFSIDGKGLPTAPINRRQVRVNNATLILSGDIGQPALRVNNDAIFSSSYVQIESNSRLGIGTIPAYPIDILVEPGDIRIKDGNQGNGKVLTSNADGIAGWANLPARAAKGVLAANIALNSGTSTNFSLSYNSNGGFSDIIANAASLANYTIPAGQSGTYLLTAQVTWQIGNSFSDEKYFHLRIRQGATEVAASVLLTPYNNINYVNRTQQTSTVLKLNAGESVGLVAFQESGAQQVIAAGEKNTFFTITRLY